ncbi:MAG: ric methyltransferase [Nitrospira sp.]|nr:ric methyltransferase [Nitrospira sp.]
MQYKLMEWTNEKIARFWDYESQFEENYFTRQVGDAVVASLVRFYAGAKTALDYGCGPGFLIPHLLNQKLEVSAVEFSPKSLEIVRRKFGANPNFKGAFESEILIRDRKVFDLIMVVEIIEHLDDKMLGKCIDTIKALLGTGGVAIFTTPNEEDLTKSYVYCPESDVVFHRWQHVRSWSKESLTSFIQAHDLSVVDAFATNFSGYKAAPLCPSPWDRIRAVKSALASRIRQMSEPRVRGEEPKLPHLVCVATR